MPRKRRSPLSSLRPPKTPKLRTLGQLSQYERDLPAWANRNFDVDIARRVRNAIASCRCLHIDYPDGEGEPQRRLFCPAAMGLKHGILKAAGMQQRTPGLAPEQMAPFISGISHAELAESEWIPTPGDIKDSTQFDPLRITHVSTCPGDPPRDHIRLFQH